MSPTLSSWSCKYEAEGLCRKVDGAFCRPGMKGCILAGKVTFQDGVIPSPVWPSEGEDGDAGPPVPSRGQMRLLLWAVAALCATIVNPAIKRIAIGSPAVSPYGVAAEQALRSAGFLDTVKGKLVEAEGILQVIQLAQGGTVQAAFVPWSMVVVPPLASLGRYVAVPAGSYSPIEQFGVVLAGARDPRLAEEFAAFVRGPTGRTILERHKYTLPPG
jgi:hypothetical protein